jgi:hypothetical protein
MDLTDTEYGDQRTKRRFLEMDERIARRWRVEGGRVAVVVAVVVVRVEVEWECSIC